MWEHYKRTFRTMQAAIATATVFIYFFLVHRLIFVTVTFFAVMQVGSLLGALWAARLKRKLNPYAA
jgi:uncharacterized membrane protein YfcA